MDKIRRNLSKNSAIFNGLYFFCRAIGFADTRGLRGYVLASLRAYAAPSALCSRFAASIRALFFSKFCVSAAIGAISAEKCEAAVYFNNKECADAGG